MDRRDEPIWIVEDDATVRAILSDVLGAYVRRRPRTPVRRSPFCNQIARLI